ncbi:replication initiation factor domain-containing protein [Acinetobacter nectaris]|uniref:replication initiation factor domain-containing protein n=1 Tax=Acinetobacter nectaris TaxID=1219382 RepID=UPI001F01863A|nr:replication initiation factor domain-containing protein [Acinetobacter nectaris]MCF9045642.1 replication initiation factor domain-containing protein [Acinetobacter nectaris]
MKNLLSLIQEFDSTTHAPVEIFKQSKNIAIEIETALKFGDIKFSVSQELQNMLSGIVANKLTALEKQLEEKIYVKTDSSIKEIFVQKILKSAQNTQGLETPFYNMGVTVSDTQQQSDAWAFPRHLDNFKILSTSEGVVPVLHTVPQDNEVVGHDWVTFSFDVLELGEEYLHLPSHMVNEGVAHGIETKLDQELYEIFGFGIGEKRQKGMHFYKYGFDLQDAFGLVLYGHKTNRISIQINGTGCALARKGWQKRLYDFLSKCASPKLNRVDLAFDDFTADHVTLDLADSWDNLDLFYTMGSRPEINKPGDWKRPNGKGRTLTIGSRKTGKYLRFYERGKKEGDPLSEWVRAEVEFKSVDRYIPLDILLSPTQYFKGAYPALEILCNELQNFQAPTKTQIVKKQAEINVKKALEVNKHQFGKYIRQFRKFISDSTLLDMLSSDKDEMPKRLKFSHAAVMQAVRIQEPIYNERFGDDLPLFVGSDILNNWSSSYAI